MRSEENRKSQSLAERKIAQLEMKLTDFDTLESENSTLKDQIHDLREKLNQSNQSQEVEIAAIIIITTTTTIK